MTSALDQKGLEPCPFCGNEAELDEHQEYRNISTGALESAIAVYCATCGAQHSICRGDIPDIQPAEVIEMWNRRSTVTPAEIAGVVEKLKAANSEIAETSLPIGVHELLREAATLIERLAAPQPSGPVEFSGNWLKRQDGDKCYVSLCRDDGKSILTVEVSKPHWSDADTNAAADTILSALTASKPEQAVPSGWKLVPEEPTEAMLAVAHHQIDWCRDEQDTSVYDHPSQTEVIGRKQVGTTCKQDLQDAWKAMLSAAPAAPTAGGGDA